MLYFLLGQIIGEKSLVVKKMFDRGKLLLKINYLSLYRAIYLFWKKPITLLLYIFWLFSRLGWRRYSLNFFRYYKGIGEFFIRNILLSIFFGSLWYYYYKQIKISGGFENFFRIKAEYFYKLFENPILTEKGYLPYAILISCLLVWGFLIFIVIYFKSIRYILKPYWKNLVLLNIVVFILLMSLFAKVGRAKFGIRVWYPTHRIYGDRLGFEFWD